jgi:hypothetical protein
MYFAAIIQSRKQAIYLKPNGATTMKKSSKSKTAAKSATVTKSAKVPTAAQAKVRSMAAFKAHLTRQNNILAAKGSPSVKSDARAAIKAITANMRSA